jgi:ABC-type uncharacterized transport system permease subunit
VLPFSNLFYNPATLIVDFKFELFEKYLFLQILWIAIAGSIALALFTKGMKRLSVNGG